MDGLAKKLEFMERRLTLLEHEVARLTAGAKAIDPPPAPPEPIVTLACDAPGLVISRCYRVERSARGEKFVWVGNDGPIQIVLAIAPREALTCHLFVWPHPRVDLANLKLSVNDLPCDHELTRLEGGQFRISAHVASSGASKINIVLSGVTSLRPSEIGGSVDTRLLAFEFFRAEAVYDFANEQGGAA